MFQRTLKTLAQRTHNIWASATSGPARRRKRSQFTQELAQVQRLEDRVLLTTNISGLGDLLQGQFVASLGTAVYDYSWNSSGFVRFEIRSPNPLLQITNGSNGFEYVGGEDFQDGSDFVYRDVYKYTSGTVGTINIYNPGIVGGFSLEWRTSALNDQLQEAYEIPAIGTPTGGMGTFTYNATHVITDLSLSGPRNVFYKWTAPTDMMMTSHLVKDYGTSDIRFRIYEKLSGATVAETTTWQTLQFAAVAGTEYIFEVINTNSNRAAGADIHLHLTPRAASNDNIANAFVVDSFEQQFRPFNWGPGSVANFSGYTMSATAESGETAHANVSGSINSVWWKWTPQANQTVDLITTNANGDPAIAVYTSSTPGAPSIGSLSLVTANDNSPSFFGNANDLNSHVRFQAIAGQTYFIAADTMTPAFVDLQLLPRPSNDDIENAATISGALQSVTGTTYGSIRDGFEESLGFAAPLVWWRWTAPSSGNVTLNSSGSSYDAPISIFSGPDMSNLQQIGNKANSINFDALQGQTYYIAVSVPDIWPLTSAGAVTLNLDQRPDNDNFANAGTLTGVVATITGANGGATSEPGEPDLPYDDTRPSSINSVWWNWTAPYDGIVEIDTFGSDFDTMLGVYIGDTVSSLIEIDSNDDSGSLQSKVTFTATQGMTYRILVDGFGSNTGNITLNLKEVPLNDSFANATILTGFSGQDISFNRTATGETGEPSIPDGGAKNTVWWRWTADHSGVATFDTRGSNFNTILSVYTSTVSGGAVNSLQLVVQNNDIDPQSDFWDFDFDLDSEVSFTATAGTEYWISVDGNGASVGRVNLNYQQDTLPEVVFPHLQLTPNSVPVALHEDEFAIDPDGGNVAISNFQYDAAHDAAIELINIYDGTGAIIDSYWEFDPYYFASLPIGVSEDIVFTFDMTDDEDNTVQGEFTITVTGENVRPVSQDFTGTLLEDEEFTGQLIGSDGNQDQLTYQIVDDSTLRGTIELSNTTPGAFTFTPEPNFFGTTSFTFVTNDGQIDSEIATATFTITSVNDEPVVNNATFSLLENSANNTIVGSASAVDVDSVTLSYAITAGNTNNAFTIDSSNGQITVNNSAALNFESTPTFTLTVEVTDNGAPQLSGSATITVNLLDVSEMPADLIGRQGGNWWVAKSDGSSGFTNQYWGAWDANAGWTDVQTADVDGDGDSDIVGRTSTGQWWVARNTGSSFNTEYWGYWSDLGWQDVLVADVDNDGDDDIVGRSLTGQWWVARSNGVTGFTNELWGGWVESAGWSHVQIADLNGDGNADIIGQANNGQWWAAQSNGSSFSTEYWGYWVDLGWQDVQVADVDNDGDSDVVGRSSTGQWWVALSNGSNQFENELWGGWVESAGWMNVLVTDLDGDGNQDIIGQANNGQWWAARSNGSTFTTEYWGYWVDLGWQDVQVIDVNQDGKADVVGRTSDGYLWVARSNGSNGFTNELWGQFAGTGWQNVMVSSTGIGSQTSFVNHLDDDDERKYF